MVGIVVFDDKRGGRLYWVQSDVMRTVMFMSLKLYESFEA